MLSAVRPKGDFRFILHEDTITVPIFKTLLLRLMVGGGVSMLFESVVRMGFYTLVSLVPTLRLSL